MIIQGLSKVAAILLEFVEAIADIFLLCRFGFRGKTTAEKH